MIKPSSEEVIVGGKGSWHSLKKKVSKKSRVNIVRTKGESGGTRLLLLSGEGGGGKCTIKDARRPWRVAKGHSRGLKTIYLDRQFTAEQIAQTPPSPDIERKGC